jgi:hypothetical protein
LCSALWRAFLTCLLQPRKALLNALQSRKRTCKSDLATRPKPPHWRHRHPNSNHRHLKHGQCCNIASNRKVVFLQCDEGLKVTFPWNISSYYLLIQMVSAKTLSTYTIHSSAFICICIHYKIFQTKTRSKQTTFLKGHKQLSLQGPWPWYSGHRLMGAYPLGNWPPG